MSDLIPPITVSQFGQRLLAVVLLVTVQGTLAAAIARALGDPGPHHDGRTRIDTFAHVDFIGLASGILFRASWTKPLHSNPRRFSNPLLGSLATTFGAAFGLAVLAALLLALRPLVLVTMPGSGGLATSTFLLTASELMVSTALLSIVPIPPLLGSVIAVAVLPMPALRLLTRVPKVIGVVVTVMLLASNPGQTALRFANTLFQSAFGL